MNRIKIICIYLTILTLTACTSQSKIDINCYIDKINYSEIAEYNINDFCVAEINDEFVYKCVKNNILTSLYCGSDGIINQIVITSQKRNDYFDKLCTESIKALTYCSQPKKIYDKAVKSGKSVYSEYQITFIDYDIGKTVIINKANAEINTNANPTLKGYIDEKNISRPALE